VEIILWCYSLEKTTTLSRELENMPIITSILASFQKQSKDHAVWTCLCWIHFLLYLSAFSHGQYFRDFSQWK
jgi:hypothetical protein